MPPHKFKTHFIFIFKTRSIKYACGCRLIVVFPFPVGCRHPFENFRNCLLFWNRVVRHHAWHHTWAHVWIKHWNWYGKRHCRPGWNLCIVFFFLFDSFLYIITIFMIGITIILFYDPLLHSVPAFRTLRTLRTLSSLRTLSTLRSVERMRRPTPPTVFVSFST